MEGWLAFSQGACGQEALIWGVEDEVGVEAGLWSEVQVFLKQREREAGTRGPARGSRAGGDLDPGKGPIVFEAPLERSREFAGPPSAIGGQIKLEIVAVDRIGQEKLRHVELP